MKKVWKNLLFVLDENRNAVPVNDFEEFSKKFNFDDLQRIVKQEYIGTIFISTVFLGTNRNHGSDGPPLVFETMIFDPNEDGGSGIPFDHYSTWTEAELGRSEEHT